MLYWNRLAHDMVIARIEFKPEQAQHFIEGAAEGQNIIEVAFGSPTELVEAMREFEDYITDCVAIVGGRVLALSSFGVH